MRTSAYAPFMLDAYFMPFRDSYQHAGITLQEGAYTTVLDCESNPENAMRYNSGQSSLEPFAPILESFGKSIRREPVQISQNSPISEKVLPSVFASRAYSLALALNRHYGEPCTSKRIRGLALECSSDAGHARAALPEDGGLYYRNKAGERIVARLLPNQLRLPMRLSFFGMPNKIKSGARGRKTLIRAAHDAREVFLRSPSLIQLASSSRVFAALSGLGKWSERLLSSRPNAGIVAGTRIIFEPGVMLAHPITVFSDGHQAESIIVHPSNRGAFTLG